MEIRVLRYFFTVAREGGINRAAEILHITQPTLSRQIASLEEEVGVKLFEQGARKITLTEGGMPMTFTEITELTESGQKTTEENFIAHATELCA